MELSTRSEAGVQIVTVEADRIDAAVAIQFKDLMRGTSDPNCDRMLLDLSKVSFVDSSGLGAIVAAMKAASDTQRMDLAALNPAVDKVFRLTRMDTIFQIFPTVEDARATSAE